MPMLPASPEQLLENILAIFPKYRPYHREQSDNEAPTFHLVVREFTPYFGAQLVSFSNSQLQDFAALVNAAVEKPSELENAFGTCFLEHLHQINAKKAFFQFLSKSAREKTRA